MMDKGSYHPQMKFIINEKLLLKRGKAQQKLKKKIHNSKKSYVYKRDGSRQNLER